MKVKVTLTTVRYLDVELTTNGLVKEWQVLGQDKPLSFEEFKEELQDHIIMDDSSELLKFNKGVEEFCTVEKVP
jgi:hypothetical protein